MSAALVIAARELRERSFVFVSAAIAALIPFLAAILPYARRAGWQQVVMIGGMIVSAALTAGLALVIGGSFVGRDLSDRRLSFYFSKPVSATAIWFGKLAGAFVTVALSFAIVFLPAFVAAREAWGGTPAAPVFAAAILVAAVYLLLLAHTVATMVRSRSPLIALDLVLLVCFAGAFWLLMRPLLAGLAVGVTFAVALAMAVALAFVIVAGGAWQLARGRTDIQRNHRELSRFFWTGTMAALAIASLYVAWIVSPGFGDLIRYTIAANARGDRIVIAGVGRHRLDYRATFLLNVQDGSSTRLPGSLDAEFNWRGDALLFVVPALQLRQPEANGELHILSLRSANAASSGTGIEACPGCWKVVSDDLTRVAISDGQLLSVYDVRTHALLGSARLPVSVYLRMRMFFASPGVLRLYVTNVPPQELSIYEFDWSRRQLLRTGTFRSSGKFSALRVTPDGSTVVFDVHGLADGPHLMLLDARTAVRRAEIRIDRGARGAALLANGDVAAIDGARHALRIFDASGVPRREIPLASGAWVGVREVVAGRKLLLSRFSAGPGRGFDIAVLDLSSGAIERVDTRVSNAGQVYSSDARAPLPSGGDYVIRDAAGTLWRCNALTGEKKRIL